MATAATPASPTTGNIDWRQEWHEFDGATYLNLAGQSPVPKSAIRAIQSAIEWKKFPHHIPDTAYFDLPNKVRGSIAKLIGGKPEEVALTAGASTGMLAVAFGLTWKPGDEVLTAVSEFPLQYTTWKPLPTILSPR
jgi:selenocysteine lyase/cysteine desulfurase